MKIKGTVITSIGFDSWKRNFNKKDNICQLVIDSKTGGHRSAAKE
jgi:hypothetical protein